MLTLFFAFRTGPAYTYEYSKLWHLLSPYQTLVPQTNIRVDTYPNYDNVKKDAPHRDATPEAIFSGMHLSPSGFQNYQGHGRSGMIRQASSSAALQDMTDHLSPQISPFSNPSNASSSFDEGVSSDYMVEPAQSTSSITSNPSEGSSNTNHSLQKLDSKRRKEQNRIKSKRHRNRMIKQRTLLTDLVADFKRILDRPDFRITTRMGEEINKMLLSYTSSLQQTNQGGSSSSSRNQGEKGQKRAKAMQREDELQHFNQVYRIASLLSEDISDPVMAIDLLFSSNVIDRDRSMFLEVFVHFRPQWDILLEAEKRLQSSTPGYPTDQKPIADLINRLDKLLGGQL